MRETNRILFVRTDRMGDVLMNLPAIRLLRQTFPKSWITVLVDGSVKDLLEGHPDIDEVFTVDTRKLKRSLCRRWKLIRDIRKASFDLAVISNPDKFMHLLAFLARIPHRVGYDRKWGFLLTHRMEDAKANANRHEMDLDLELASLASDRAWDGKVFLPVDETAKARVEALLKEADCDEVLAVHPGTSNPLKRWSALCFADLCDRIQMEKGLKVILIGGAEEAVLAEGLTKKTTRPVINWVGKLTLKELAAFLSSPHVKALVSCDSGPVHVAWINGTPVVALYAKNVPGSNPIRWGPRDEKSRVIYKPMSQISSDEVYASVEKILAS